MDKVTPEFPAALRCRQLLRGFPGLSVHFFVIAELGVATEPELCWTAPALASKGNLALGHRVGRLRTRGEDHSLPGVYGRVPEPAGRP